MKIKEAKNKISIYIGIFLLSIFLLIMAWAVYSDMSTPESERQKITQKYSDEKKLNEELTSRTDKSSNSPTIKPDGDYSSGAYNSNCKKYALSRKECAVAANYSQCMELKGSNSAYVNLCSDDGKIR